MTNLTYPRVHATFFFICYSIYHLLREESDCRFWNGYQCTEFGFQFILMETSSSLWLISSNKLFKSRDIHTKSYIISWGDFIRLLVKKKSARKNSILESIETISTRRKRFSIFSFQKNCCRILSQVKLPICTYTTSMKMPSAC